MIALFVFRRDFRTVSNPAWNRCVKWCQENNAKLAPCFLFSSNQTDARKNPYFSKKAFSAMRLFLHELNKELDGNLTELQSIRGDDIQSFTKIFEQNKVKAVFFNRDVTPYARDRDASLRELCERKGIECDWGDPGEGYLVWHAGLILTKSGTIPKVFSAFYRYARDKDVVPPETVTISPILTRLSVPKGMEPMGLPVVDIEIPEIYPVSSHDDYGKTRNDYQIPTTRYSVYLKFGRLEVCKLVSDCRKRGNVELERQLIWREFYYHLVYGYRDILSKGKNLHIRPDREKVSWSSSKSKTESWVKGETGEKLVDDAMKLLGKTGYIHNRLRMVVASYYTKVLKLDWRDGEKAMARMLIDYDPSQNSGGWQSMDAQVPGQEIKASTQLKKFGSV